LVAVPGFSGSKTPRPHGAARVPSLDGLRAIAVGLVFVSHLYNESDAIAALGPIGVRIFFVISGFIITKLLLDEREATGRVSLKAFYLRRTYRIFPACYAYIAFVFALSVVGIAKDLKVSDIVFGLTYTTNYAPRVHWSVAHLWSLAVEEQFYLVWPFLFMTLSDRGARRLLGAVLILAPVSRAVSYAYTADPTPIDHMFHTVADSLATGCLIGLGAAAWKRVPVYRMLPSALIYAWMAMVIVAASLYHQSYRGAYYWLGLSVLNLSIALFVLRVTEARDLVTRVLNSRVMTGLGLISYSLYLWQQPFLYPFAHPNPLQRFPINLACAAVAALGSYYLVEKPIRRWGTRLPRRETHTRPASLRA
jgi:peptidoglycan/LPS O-acetylase OafA/YrhL